MKKGGHGMKKYQSTVDACRVRALRFRDRIGSVPYLITDGFAYHVIVRIGGRCYDKFGVRSLTDIVEDVERSWGREGLKVCRLTWEQLERFGGMDVCEIRSELGGMS